jgi:hypothetical protein
MSDVPWRIELCISVKASGRDECSDLADRIERYARRIGGERVAVFGDEEGQLTDPGDLARFAPAPVDRGGDA